MKKVTVDDIMAHCPCEEYPRERVEELWGGRESLTLTEILDLGIPAKDRIWASLQFLSEKETGQFARWCALQVVHLWDCPDVVKRYLETVDEGLRGVIPAAAQDAARTTACTTARTAARAAWNAALAVAWNASWAAAAAWNASWAADAAWNAADAAAREEERPKQIEKLKELVKCAE